MLEQTEQIFLLSINPEYEQLLPKLSEEEVSELKKSIQKNGLFYPIIINEDNVILDGHHRYQVCKELGINPKSEQRIFENKLDEREFVLDSNVKRRQLETWQRCEIAEKYWEIEKERARIRKLSQLTNVGDELPLPTNDRERGEALEIAAHKANVGYQTLRKYNYAKKIAPQLILDIQKGELSINKAEKDAKKIEHNIQPERVEIPQAAENLNEKLFLTNVWQLPESRPKGYGSSDFRGNCDPTIIDQCIRRYVMNPHIPEDVILLDPMAGSGTFLDVALKLGFDRKDILAYDLNKRRDDIEIQDVSNLPIDDKTVNLIFCHYPYWDMWKYSEQKQDLSNCDYKEFLRRVTQSFKEFKRVLKKKGYVCVLIGNKRQNGVIDMEADISKIGQEIFGKPWDKIITIVGDPAGHASSAHGNWGLVTHRALKNKWTIQNYDTLLIFRKKC